MRRFLLLLVTGALIAIPSQATAALSEVGIDGVVDDPAVALERDLAEIAQANGWTTSDADTYDRARRAMDQLALRVSGLRPDAYVGVALASDPRGTPTLYIKGPADAGIRDAVAGVGVAVQGADQQPFSLRELRERRDRVHASLMALGYASVVSIDITTGRISATIGSSPGVSTDAILSQLSADLRGDVALAARETPPFEPQAVKGGLVTTDEQIFKCTSGFTVIKILGGTRGIASAGHCTSVDHIYDHIGGYWHELFYQNAHEGQWGDFEWYTSTLNELDDFHASQSEIRDVAGFETIGALMVNEFVCNFGWGTGLKNCTAKIKSTEIRCGAGNSRFVQMDRDITEGGDSGGPWYFGNFAYGIHYGLCGGLSSFSAVDYLDEALGIRVTNT